MKTMANQDESVVVRVSEEKAEIMQHEGFHFVPKSMWKEQVRDVNREPEVNQETGNLELKEKKSNKMSKSTKRHLRKNKKN